jgi:hypothetical protein
MSLVESLGTSFPMILIFLGVLLLSVTTALIALLADY